MVRDAAGRSSDGAPLLNVRTSETAYWVRRFFDCVGRPAEVSDVGEEFKAWLRFDLDRRESVLYDVSQAVLAYRQQVRPG